MRHYTVEWYQIHLPVLPRSAGLLVWTHWGRGSTLGRPTCSLPPAAIFFFKKAFKIVKTMLAYIDKILMSGDTSYLDVLMLWLVLVLVVLVDFLLDGNISAAATSLSQETACKGDVSNVVVLLWNCNGSIFEDLIYPRRQDDDDRGFELRNSSFEIQLFWFLCKKKNKLSAEKQEPDWISFDIWGFKHDLQNLSDRPTSPIIKMYFPEHKRS